MTTNPWQIVLNISYFIAQLIAPTLALLVMYRINRPKPTPSPNHPKNLIQRLGGGLISFLRSPWRVALLIVLPGILFNIYSPHTELRNTVPITRGSVLLISLAVMGIWFNILNVSVLWIWRSIERQIDIISKQTDVASGILDLIIAVREDVAILRESIGAVDKLHTEVETRMQAELSQTHPDKPASPTLDRVLAAIKALFGD
jgi:hypothetical protein